MLILPTGLGFQSKFQTWRTDQGRVIEDGLDSKKRFVGQVQGCGRGKSLSYMAQVVISKARAMILTGTRGLQTQLMDDFSSVGLVDIRGKANYDCQCFPGRTCEQGTISKCSLTGNACTWSRAKDKALNSQMVTTNYACWISTLKYGRGFGVFDHLILDEAHNTPDFLNQAVSVLIGDKEVREDLKLKWPDSSDDDMESWKMWATLARRKAEVEYKALEEKIGKALTAPEKLVNDYRRFRNMARKLSDVAICTPSNWVADQWSGGYRFDPIDPSKYGEKIIFSGIPKVTFISGTIKRRTLEMCGVDPQDMDFFEYPEALDISRSPLMFIPTAWMQKDSDEGEWRRMVARIDEIIESRADRRIIVHTVSNRLRDYIISKSKYSRFMLSNYARKGDVTAEVIRQFKLAKPPAVLVSPSVTTGYDFPMEDCRVQIIAKLPYPDNFSAKVDRVRNEQDPKRGIFHMFQTLAQMFKRGDRGDSDFQEVFILDNNVEKAMRMYGDLAPSWLPPYYRKVFEIPVAPYLG